MKYVLFIITSFLLITSVQSETVKVEVDLNDGKGKRELSYPKLSRESSMHLEKLYKKAVRDFRRGKGVDKEQCAKAKESLDEIHKHAPNFRTSRKLSLAVENCLNPKPAKN